MKTSLALAFLAFVSAATADAADRFITECRLPKANLSISIYSDASAHLRAVFAQNGKRQSQPIVEGYPLTRAQIAKDADLLDILHATGLDVSNILGGSAYVTDVNSVGKTGLIVFRAARGKIVGQAYFSTAAGFIEPCAETR